MNPSKVQDDFSGDGNVSRSGRVRKKSSLLAGFESLESSEKPKKKGGNVGKRYKDSTPAKVTLKFEDDVQSGQQHSIYPKKKAGKKSDAKKIKLSQEFDNTSRPDGYYGSMEPLSTSRDDYEEGDLEIDLPPEFMPDLAAEEIIDDSLLDGDDDSSGLEIHGVGFLNSKLKSQAQSTYMMEKSFEKNRKTSQSGSSGKIKAVRKDKGTPRVTAYMLWAKEQREMFAKKYPNLDFTSLSKKLSDLWATVPPNQKKMWKNKAAKIMRKNANVTENMKNSGPLPLPKGKKPRGRPRIHPVDDEKNGNGETSFKISQPSKSPQGSGKIMGKKAGSHFQQKKDIKTFSAPNVQSPWKNSTTKPHSSKVSNNSKGLGPSKIKSRNHNFSTEIRPALKSNSSTALRPFSSSTKYISPRKEDENIMYKVTGTSPMDVAAHFALLGESLSIIGERLKDVEGQAVSGSLSVLLDSLLCATGPLLCLSQQVPELNCIPQDKLNHILNNIAYVMPGL